MSSEPLDEIHWLLPGEFTQGSDGSMVTGSPDSTALQDAPACRAVPIGRGGAMAVAICKIVGVPTQCRTCGDGFGCLGFGLDWLVGFGWLVFQKRTDCCCGSVAFCSGSLHPSIN